jgi:polysaccharide deacetylase 2 family uncharacterized protein YibQ
MNDEQARNKFISDLGAVPGVVGVSNHMGSAYSADEPKMRKLLAMVKERSLFYLDSYTSTKSTARSVQKALGMPLLRNDVFLDTDDDPAHIRRQFQILLKQVKRYGRAIAIGHIHKKNLVSALKEFIPECNKAGIEFVYLTGMVD